MTNITEQHSYTVAVTESLQESDSKCGFLGFSSRYSNYDSLCSRRADNKMVKSERLESSRNYPEDIFRYHMHNHQEHPQTYIFIRCKHNCLKID